MNKQFNYKRAESKEAHFVDEGHAEEESMAEKFENLAWFKNERFRVTLSKPQLQVRNRYRNRLSSIKTMAAPKDFLDPDLDFDPDTLLPGFEPGRKFRIRSS